tara:strand:+ start:2314 stop:3636 length:1323 start_codon:yes stop_codon:yes gene_type:complete
MSENKLILPYKDVPIDIDSSTETYEELPPLDREFIKDDLAGDGVKAIYNKRINYTNEILNGYRDYPNLVNFNFAEKHLYGRVNRVFTPIVPTADGALELVVLPRTGMDSNTFRAFNFVADSYRELSSQFRKATAMKKISTTSPFLSELKVYKAYENPLNLYYKHRIAYAEGIVELLLSDGIEISNFKEFVVKMMPYLQKTAREHPFTLPAFVKSNYCPINTSGLVIEISDVKPSEDIIKIEQFVGSVNWDYYLNACLTYGFMVDRMYPWRLVADIGSPPMIEKSAQYGATTTDMVLRNGYELAHRTYYQGFASQMLDIYNRVKKPKTKVMNCGSSLKVSTSKPVDYSPVTFSQQFDVLYIFRLYCNIRFYEEESQFRPYEKNKLIEDCSEIARYDPISAADVFERILNKTFDYAGSLQYIKDKYDRIDLAEAEKDVFPDY